ncbi:hypothetical protein ASG17_10875 [Brevundimonas sp. Leaf363]|nr:hypothetical protein ASG17_10875 [Brevundimonas sp. Leaf363]
MAPASGPAAFTYEEPDDISGYYLPASDAEAGGYVLDHVFLGQPAEFEAWQAGTRSATFAPVMLEFQNAATTQRIGMEADGPGRGIRVLPTRYSLDGGRVHFEGTARPIGRVVFDGRLDKDALASAKRNLGGAETPVVVGRLKVGGEVVENVRLAWFGGD